MIDSSRTFHMTRTPHYDDPNFYRFVSYLTLDVSESTTHRRSTGI